MPCPSNCKAPRTEAPCSYTGLALFPVFGWLFFWPLQPTPRKAENRWGGCFCYSRMRLQFEASVIPRWDGLAGDRNWPETSRNTGPVLEKRDEFWVPFFWVEAVWGLRWFYTQGILLRNSNNSSHGYRATLSIWTASDQLYTTAKSCLSRFPKFLNPWSVPPKPRALIFLLTELYCCGKEPVLGNALKELWG